MVMQSSGPISIDDITDEFGGTPPDNTNEYYRDGGLVTSNNIGIPTSGEISLSDFYGSVKQLAITLATGVNNATIANYFTPAEWNSATPKVFTISSGVTVGSTSSGSPALRTGTTREGLAMGGTLKVVNNGYVYGAGGAVNSGTGGDAFIADVACSIDNTNGRMYGGGGGGGVGGRGAIVNYYPETVSYKQSLNPYSTPNYYWLHGNGVASPSVYWNNIKVASGSADQLIPSPVLYSGFYYEIGADVGGAWAGKGFSLRRRVSSTYYGNGGGGGRGIGSNQSATNGSTGSTNQTTGGTGGNGGGWGASGNTGGGGGGINPTYHTQTSAAAGGAIGGLAGRYIVGNASVTWLGNGLRLGRVA